MLLNYREQGRQITVGFWDWSSEYDWQTDGMYSLAGVGFIIWFTLIMTNVHNTAIMILGIHLLYNWNIESNNHNLINAFCVIISENYNEEEADIYGDIMEQQEDLSDENRSEVYEEEVVCLSSSSDEEPKNETPKLHKYSTPLNHHTPKVSFWLLWLFSFAALQTTSLLTILLKF